MISTAIPAPTTATSYVPITLLLCFCQTLHDPEDLYMHTDSRFFSSPFAFKFVNLRILRKTSIELIAERFCP